MTLLEFIEEFEKHAVDFTWREDTKGRLRGTRDHYEFCPITAVCLKVAGKRHAVALPDVASKDLDLDSNAYFGILGAADNLVLTEDEEALIGLTLAEIEAALWKAARLDRTRITPPRNFSDTLIPVLEVTKKDAEKED